MPQHQQICLINLGKKYNSAFPVMLRLETISFRFVIPLSYGEKCISVLR